MARHFCFGLVVALSLATGLSPVAGQTDRPSGDDDAVIERLVATVGDKESSPEKRTNACVALGKLGPKAKKGVSAMVDFLQGDLLNEEGRMQYCISKKNGRHAGAVKHTEAVIAALGEIGPEASGAVDVLMKAATWKVFADERIFREIDGVVTSRGDYVDVSDTINVSAVRTLVKIGSPKAVPTLVTAAGHAKSSTLRLEAVKALAILGNVASPDERRRIVTELTVIKSVDENEAVKAAAEKALETLAPASR